MKTKQKTYYLLLNQIINDSGKFLTLNDCCCSSVLDLLFDFIRLHSYKTLPI